MRRRQHGKYREKITLFVYPDLQYMLEYMAVQHGFVRKKTKSRLKDRPDLNGFLEQYLTHQTGLANLPVEQRLQMEQYQNYVNEQRLLERVKASE